MNLCMNIGNENWLLNVVDCPEDILQAVEADLEPYIRLCSETAPMNENCGKVICMKSDEEYVHQKDMVIQVKWTTSIRLRTLLRKIVRSYFYKLMASYGWVQIHAGAVINRNDEVFLFAGGKGAGKTSSILASILKNNDIRFISNDRVLIHPSDSYTIGWPTAVGIGNETKDILKIKQSGYVSHNKSWFWPNEIREMGIDIAKGGRIKKIIVPAFDLKAKNIEAKEETLDAPSLLLKNIRDDALNEDQYWEIPVPKQSEYGSWISTTDWCKQLVCTRIICGGLSDDYFDILKKMIYV